MAKTGKRKAKQQAARKAAAETTTRRGFIDGLKWKLGGAAAVGFGGFFLFDHFDAVAAEHDLSRIGKGAPKVVQIHDPQCPKCMNLQREARAALDGLGDQRLCYLVANTRTTKGRNFATAYGVGTVTLVLFDGAGRVARVLPGERPRRELRLHFEALAAAEA